jgi:competence protein ComEC
MLPLLWPLVAAIAGILISPFLEPHAVWLCLPLAVLLAFATKKCGGFLSIILLGAGLRALEPAVPPDPGEDAVRLVGTLEKAPEWRGPGVYLDVRLQNLDARPYYGRARLSEFLDDPELRKLFDDLHLGSGDRLEILVKLHRPAVYRDPGVFDVRRHFERQQIYWTGTIRNPRLITVLHRGWHGPDQIRKWISRRLEEPFARDPEAQGLMMGMVLGRKYGLSAHVARQFQAGGLYHLVVVSGFNLAVIAGIGFWLARLLPCRRRTRLILVLLMALGYAILVEGQVPVTRAMLMVVFVILGKVLDRGYAVGNSIVGAALIILLIDPTSLEDPSFQMTFAAVIAVIGIGMPAVKWSLGWLREALAHFDDVQRDGQLTRKAADWRVSKRLWCELYGMPAWVVRLPWQAGLALAEIAIVSACVEVVLMIFMIESFHRMSPISPLLNVPAGLVAAAVTPLGLATIVLPHVLARPFALAAAGLLHALLTILDVSLRLPGATMRVPSTPAGVWAVYGVCVAAMVWAIRTRRIRVLVVSGAAVLVLQSTVALADFSEAPPKDVTLTFIDVGQGDSILAEFPDGKRMLIDGGGVTAGRFLNLQDESGFSIGESVVSPFLWSKRIRKLDAVVLTHAHHDHMNGLLDVIENFDIGELWLGRNPMGPQYRELLRRAMSRQIPLRFVSGNSAPDANFFPGITVLHPPANWKPRRNDENNDSVVLLLNTGEATALLTGDIERAIPAPPEVDVYKIPHHGSKGVKLKVRARIRVISVGANNPFGHPHPSALPALRTDRLGAITVTLTDPPVVASALTTPRHWYKLSHLLESH